MARAAAADKAARAAAEAASKAEVMAKSRAEAEAAAKIKAEADAKAAKYEADATGVFCNGSSSSMRGGAPRDRAAARSRSPAGQSAGRFERAVVNGDDSASGRARTSAGSGRT